MMHHLPGALHVLEQGKEGEGEERISLPLQSHVSWRRLAFLEMHVYPLLLCCAALRL